MAVSRRWALVLFLALLTGCEDGATEPRIPSVTGQWLSTLSVGGTALDIHLTLVEEPADVGGGRDVVGHGTVSLEGTEFVITIEDGRHAYPGVAMTLEFDVDFQPMVFTGSFTGADLIQGRLNGSGFDNEPTDLRRQVGG